MKTYAVSMEFKSHPSRGQQIQAANQNDAIRIALEYARIEGWRGAPKKTTCKEVMQ